jgi:hypothetical protein
MATSIRRHDKMDCTCGSRYGLDSSGSVSSKGAKNVQFSFAQPARYVGSPSLDASFVHLPPSLLVRQEESRSLSRPIKTNIDLKHSTVDRYKHLAFLERAAANAARPPAMCMECMQRVDRAIQVDTERIESEAKIYRETIVEENARIKNWKRALRSAATDAPTTSDMDRPTPSRFNEMERAKHNFQMEIEGLSEVCRQHEEELAHLLSVRQEFARVAKKLDVVEEAMYQDVNSLELEALAFHNDQEQLFRLLAEIQSEADCLSSTAIRLPSLLLSLNVDKERGLRYPLINDLRLAYRPKGDVQWDEIQAAWSLAAQLLLYVGTIFHFQSRHWRVVPLSSCAKLIFYPPKEEKVVGGRSKGCVVYNLGHPKTHTSRSFLAWNALLHQLASCVLGKMNQACEEGMMELDKVPRLPYEMTSTKIGAILLTELDENDDAGWSRAIHCMSSNLLWLSDCGSVFVLHQILPQCLS